jgi:chaperonin GroES
MVARNISFECLGDNVLLEEIKVKETLGGLQLPDTVQQEGPGRARVVKVGPGRLNDDGKLLPMPVKEGDVVYCLLSIGAGRYGPMKVPIDGHEYIVLSAQSLIGKVPT